MQTQTFLGTLRTYERSGGCSAMLFYSNVAEQTGKSIGILGAAY